MINPGHVARAGWRRVFRMECKAVHVHVRVWDRGMELIWLHEPEPRAWLLRESRLIVEVQRCKFHWIAVVNSGVVEPIVALFLALATHSPHELDYGMVELELQLNIRILRLSPD
eukprot:4881474-Pleurochrysis_carterae.AAC.1